MGAVAYLDRVNISIAGAEIAKEFHLSNVQLGWVFSAFIAGYALFQAPAGRLADRYGARLVLTVAILWWAIFTSVITLISPKLVAPLIALITIRFLLGVGEAPLYPAANCIVVSWVPSAERGIANGLIGAGVGIGAGITPPVIAYFILHYGWRASFWASSAIGLTAGLLWYVIARDRPSLHPWITRKELTRIELGLPRTVSREGATAKLSLGAIVRNHNVRALTFSYFCFGYMAYIFFSWFFIYLNIERGLNLRQSSYYSMLPFLAMAVCSPLGGWVSDRITRVRGARAGRCKLSAVSMGISALFLVLGMRAQTAPLASVVLAGGAGALYLSQSCFWSLSADIGKQSAGSVTGVINMGSQTGGALTASLTPLIASHFGWTAAFLVAAGLAAAGALAWLVVEPPADNDPRHVNTSLAHSSRPVTNET